MWGQPPFDRLRAGSGCPSSKARRFLPLSSLWIPEWKDRRKDSPAAGRSEASFRAQGVPARLYPVYLMISFMCTDPALKYKVSSDRVYVGNQ